MPLKVTRELLSRSLTPAGYCTGSMSAAIATVSVVFFNTHSMVHGLGHSRFIPNPLHTSSIRYFAVGSGLTTLLTSSQNNPQAIQSHRTDGPSGSTRYRQKGQNARTARYNRSEANPLDNNIMIPVQHFPTSQLRHVNRHD